MCTAPLPQVLFVSCQPAGCASTQARPRCPVSSLPAALRRPPPLPPTRYVHNLGGSLLLDHPLGERPHRHGSPLDPPLYPATPSSLPGRFSCRHPSSPCPPWGSVPAALPHPGLAALSPPADLPVQLHRVPRPLVDPAPPPLPTRPCIAAAPAPWPPRPGPPVKGLLICDFLTPCHLGSSRPPWDWLSSHSRSLAAPLAPLAAFFLISKLVCAPHIPPSPRHVFLQHPPPPLPPPPPTRPLSQAGPSPPLRFLCVSSVTP